jgi:ketosteroid isomerase-like protein
MLKSLQRREGSTMWQMKSLILAIVFLCSWGAPAVPWKQSQSNERSSTMTTAEKNIETMLAIFRNIEERDPKHPDPQKQLQLIQPDVEFHWPPSLPYGGTHRGLANYGPNWGKTWNPLQPTPADRKLSPRVIAASNNEVVILWRQRGVSPLGEHLDTEVLGLYQLRDAKLARAQMFYFDETAVAHFLCHAAVSPHD